MKRGGFSASTVSMFFGTIPMELATIINGFGVRPAALGRRGDSSPKCWWISVAMSLAMRRVDSVHDVYRVKTLTFDQMTMFAFLR